MIFIFSETYDSMTDRVCMWLRYYHKPFVRFNHNAANRITEIFYSTQRDEICFVTDHEKEININEISAVWFRRGRLMLPRGQNEQEYHEVSPLLYQHLKKERETTEEAINQILYQSIFSIGNPNKQELNKIITLNMAQKAGFKVPDTAISDSKERVISKFGEEKLFSKTINDLFEIEFAERKFQYRNIAFKSAAAIPESFTYSLFQTKIDIKTEIRVFHLMGENYSIAQHYNSGNQPGNWQKYELSASVSKKIRHLMTALDLNCGSIDLLLDRQNECFFLEVNPVGQLEWVSDYGNYYIDKIIAQTLINSSYEFKTR